MVSSDGRTRVHHVSLDGQELIRIEKLGTAQPIAGPRRSVWTHVHDARTVQEVARHVDLADLSPA